MGKIWNWIASESPEEYRQRETLRHTKRIADSLERQQTQPYIDKLLQLATSSSKKGGVKKKCKSCGKKISKKAKFCAYCGAKQ